MCTRWGQQKVGSKRVEGERIAAPASEEGWWSRVSWETKAGSALAMVPSVFQATRAWNQWCISDFSQEPSEA